MRVHLPAGRAVGLRRFAEDFDVAVEGLLHAAAGPRHVARYHIVLPHHMIPGMAAAFAAGMVGSERKQEGGISLILPQQLYQIGYAFACAAISIDIDFKRKQGHGSLRCRFNPSALWLLQPGRDKHRKYCATYRPCWCSVSSSALRRYS